VLDNSTDNSPYLHRPRDIDFCGSKIVVPQRSYQNTFAYNDIPWYASADVYFITEKERDVSIKYCLALLNSKLYYLWLYHKGKRKGEMLELYQVPLSEIPIKKIPKTDQKPFISIVDKILAVTKDEDYLADKNKRDHVKELEREIDELVYGLYGLTNEERQIVGNSSK
jgi:adenine-specific DNA-methyltransferase